MHLIIVFQMRCGNHNPVQIGPNLRVSEVDHYDVLYVIGTSYTPSARVVCLLGICEIRSMTQQNKCWFTIKISEYKFFFFHKVLEKILRGDTKQFLSGLT